MVILVIFAVSSLFFGGLYMYRLGSLKALSFLSESDENISEEMQDKATKAGILLFISSTIFLCLLVSKN